MYSSQCAAICFAIAVLISAKRSLSVRLKRVFVQPVSFSQNSSCFSFRSLSSGESWLRTKP
jgi:hypothetical protein